MNLIGTVYQKATTVVFAADIWEFWPGISADVVELEDNLQPGISSAAFATVVLLSLVVLYRVTHKK